MTVPKNATPSLFGQLPHPPPVSQGDCIAWLQTLASESVELVITDPAYESLEKHRKVGTTTRLKNSKSSSNEWFDIFGNERFPALFTELYRVMRPNTHLYVMCDQETMFVIKPMGEDAGFKFWKPLIWDKVNIGMGYHFRARYECILFFEKGKRKINDLSMPDILTHKRIHRPDYPTEKPIPLLENLVVQSSEPGQLVIDPFLGSGSTGEAALSNGRRFAGCDLSETACDRASTRLAGVIDA